MINRLIDIQDLDYRNEQELFAYLRSKSMTFGYIRKYKLFRIDFSHSFAPNILTDSNFILYGRDHSFVCPFGSRKEALAARNKVYRRFLVFDFIYKTQDINKLSSPLTSLELIRTIDSFTNNLELISNHTTKAFFSTLVSKYDVNRYDHDLAMEIKKLCLLNINDLFRKWKSL